MTESRTYATQLGAIAPQLGATAPQLPELTDQEILEVALQLEPLKGTTMEQAFIYFARAVLNKARGKLTI
jgi:hypothetical protein